MQLSKIDHIYTDKIVIITEEVFYERNERYLGRVLSSHQMIR